MLNKINLSNIPTRIKNKFECDKFYGVDFTGGEDISFYRSPDAVNFISDGSGSIKKRTGFQKVIFGNEIDNISGEILGVHIFRVKSSKPIIILHKGAYYFINPYDKNSYLRPYPASLNVSRAFMSCEKLFIIDGKHFYVYDGIDFKNVTDIAYIPTVLIGKAPGGGGTSFESVNLLSDFRKETFLSDEVSTVYNLGSKDINAITKVEKKTGGAWVAVDSKVKSYDLANGKVEFFEPFEKSEVEGEDNVRITYKKHVQSNFDKICRCRYAALYGYNGESDRLFLSGNIYGYRNVDFYSEKNNFTYFKDTSFCVIGNDDSDIVGYLRYGEYLATFKNGRSDQDNTNVVMRKAEMINGEVQFIVTGQYQSASIISDRALGYCGSEALFLADNGINALCQSSVLGEKYAQSRSYYINKKLLAEKNLEKAFAVAFKDKFYVFINSHVYILDTMQYSGNINTPYSARQYECFYWENINACYAYEFENSLYFGTLSGDIYKFYSDYEDIKSFCDDDKPIKAYWKTPVIDGGSFYNRKNLSYISVRVRAFKNTSLQISALEEGKEEIVKDYSGHGKFMDFSYIDFNGLNFSSDRTQRTIGEKIRVKGIDKIQFKFENGRMFEPLELKKYAFEYRERGKYIK